MVSTDIVAPFLEILALFGATIGDFWKITGNYDAMVAKCKQSEVDGMTFSNVRQNCDMKKKQNWSDFLWALLPNFFKVT